jgi:hypothetical protein
MDAVLAAQPRKSSILLPEAFLQISLCVSLIARRVAAFNARARLPHELLINKGLFSQ